MVRRLDEAASTRNLTGHHGLEPRTSQQPALDNKSNNMGAKRYAAFSGKKAKGMLMRVGFEPTPFRTSDSDVPDGNTLS
jgi:hypothetical protein